MCSYFSPMQANKYTKTWCHTFFSALDQLRRPCSLFMVQRIFYGMSNKFFFPFLVFVSFIRAGLVWLRTKYSMDEYKVLILLFNLANKIGFIECVRILYWIDIVDGQYTFKIFHFCCCVLPIYPWHHWIDGSLAKIAPTRCIMYHTYLFFSFSFIFLCACRQIFAGSKSAYPNKGGIVTLFE